MGESYIFGSVLALRCQCVWFGRPSMFEMVQSVRPISIKVATLIDIVFQAILIEADIVCGISFRNRVYTCSSILSGGCVVVYATDNK